jgi:hypothetical protein
LGDCKVLDYGDYFIEIGFLEVVSLMMEVEVDSFYNSIILV